MLNHTFSLLPLGSLAYKANLLSALCAVLTCTTLYLLLVCLGIGRFIAFVSALTFGFSFAFWSQAVVAEVYTLHLLLMTLVLYMLVSWHLTRRERYFYLATALYALSFGNHLLSVVLLPAFAYFVWVTDRSVFVQPKKVLWVVLVVGLGALQYGYLFWRFGDPTTSIVETFNGKNLFYYVTGGPFKPLMFAFSPAEIVQERLALFGFLIVDDLKIVPLFALPGGVLLWRANRPICIFLLLYYIAGAIYVLNYDIPDISVYFSPNDLVTVILASFFGARALYWARGRAKWAKVVPVLAVLVPLSLFALNLSRVDKHGDVEQQENVETVLDAVGKDAIVMTDNYQSGQGFVYYLLGEGLGARDIYTASYRTNHLGLRAYLEDGEPLRLVERRKRSKVGLPLYIYPCGVAALKQQGFSVTGAWAGVEGLCRIEAGELNLSVAYEELARAGLFENEGLVQNDYSAEGLFQEGLFTENLTLIEGADALVWRWGLGPATRLRFRLAEAQPLELTLRFSTPFEREVTVAINGKTLARELPLSDEVIERTLAFRGRAGKNEILIRYGDWNGRYERLFANERMKLAVRFEKLNIKAGQPAVLP